MEVVNAEHGVHLAKGNLFFDDENNGFDRIPVSIIYDARVTLLDPMAANFGESGYRLDICSRGES